MALFASPKGFIWVLPPGKDKKVLCVRVSSLRKMRALLFSVGCRSPPP